MTRLHPRPMTRLYPRRIARYIRGAMLKIALIP
jgi:hypothetical protein